MAANNRTTSNSEQTVWQKWTTLLVCCAVVGVIWLWVLPMHSATEASRKQWEYWDSRGIDPAATYYSELECHSSVLANWKRRHAAQLKKSTE